MPKTAAFLSIRDKSTRLPGKSLAPIEGRSVCSRLLGRLRMAKRVDLVVLATSTNPQDAGLCEVAASMGVPAFRGSEDDKLRRYLDAADAHGVDFMVVVDGDDLFVSEEHLDEVVEAWLADGGDFVTHDGLPFGAASFGVRRDALAEVVANKLEHDTEVWGDYFLKNPRMRCRLLPVADPLFRRPDVRMTLDYPEDLAFFETVHAGLGTGARIPAFREVMGFLADHPEVVALNQGVRRKYEENLQKRPKARWKQ